MYDITQLFFYKPIFVIEILIAFHMIAYPLDKKSYYPLRLVLAILFSIGIAFATPIVSYSSWYISIMFFMLFGITTLLNFFVYKTKMRYIIFYGITAYTLQHICHEIYSMVTSSFDIFADTNVMYTSKTFDIFALEKTDIFLALIYLAIYLLFYGIAYFTIGKKLDRNSISIKNTSLLWLTGLLLAIAIILNAVVIYLPEGTSKPFTYITSIYNLISCFMILYIQVILVRNKKIENQLEVTEQLLRLSQLEFENKKKNMELINQKCHDLKHQIRVYGQKRELNDDTIKEIESTIEIYDSSVQTGNPSIDLILNEKSLECHKHHINFTCIADCSKLNFMSSSDLYSLIGNAMDNAMEAVIQVEDVEKRNISLKVRTVNQFVIFHIENYYENEIRFGEDHLPLTSKEDTLYHGFGIKSIKMIVDKYGGDLTISTDGNSFALNITLPIEG